MSPDAEGSTPAEPAPPDAEPAGERASAPSAVEPPAAEVSSVDASSAPRAAALEAPVAAPAADEAPEDLEEPSAAEDAVTKDETPEDETPEDGTPGNGTPKDEGPAGEAPAAGADGAPADEALADEALANEALADEALADEALADEALADEAPADEALADEALADEALADEALADEALADEALGDGAPADEAPAYEALGTGAPTDPSPADGAPSLEVPQPRGENAASPPDPLETSSGDASPPEVEPAREAAAAPEVASPPREAAGAEALAALAPAHASSDARPEPSPPEAEARPARVPGAGTGAIPLAAGLALSGRSPPRQSADRFHEASHGADAPSGSAHEAAPAASEDPKVPLPPETFSRSVALFTMLIGSYLFVRYGFSPETTGEIAKLVVHERALSEFGTQAYRLVSGTLAHTNVMLALFSLLLLWATLGDFEERAGSGPALCLLVLGGALLNAVRVQVEPASSLHALSGAWPAGIAAGAAAAVLARRRGEGIRRQVTLVVVQSLLLAAFVFFAGGLWNPGLVETALAAVGLGAIVGALWPSGVRATQGLTAPPPSAAGRRLAAGIVAVALLAASLFQASQGDGLPPQPREVPPLTSHVHAEPLLVELDLPGGWSEHPTPKTVECGTCGEVAKWDDAKVNDPIPPPKQCKKCSDEVLHGNRYFALYASGAAQLFGERRMALLFAQDRQAYDDPDTFIEWFIEYQLRRDDSEFREASIELEEFFQTEAFERGYRKVLRAKKERATLYSFRTQKRTILIMFRGPCPDSPLSLAYENALHEAIARSMRPAKPKPAEPTQSPTPSPPPAKEK